LLYELLYTSALADSAHPNCAVDIVRTARHRNADLDVTGVLIFDGAHFCQYLEGPQASVLQVVKRIAADHRHINLIIRHQGEFDSERRFAGSALAYVVDDQGSIIDKVIAAEARQAVATLLQHLPKLDAP